MICGIRTIYSCELNKGFGSKFCVGSKVWHKTPEEGQKVHQLKHCEYINNNEDNSLIALIDKNYQASFPKFRWIRSIKVLISYATNGQASKNKEEN